MCQYHHLSEGLGFSAWLQATEADNTSKDPAKMVCHCLATATSCPVITGQSRSGNDHWERELSQNFQCLFCHYQCQHGPSALAAVLRMQTHIMWQMLIKTCPVPNSVLDLVRKKVNKEAKGTEGRVDVVITSTPESVWLIDSQRMLIKWIH